MKKLLFDLSVCQPNRESKFHGGGVYGIIVFKALAEHCDNSNLIVYLDKSKYIDSEVIELLTNKNIEIVDSSSIRLHDLISSRNDIAALYSPLFKAVYTHISNIPILVTVHGLRALEMNRDKYEIMYETSLAGRLKAIIKQTPLYNLLWRKYYNSYKNIFDGKNIKYITVSEHSKYSILSHYPEVEESDIKVLYSPSTTSLNPDAVKSYDSEPYFLIVSANRWIKNAYRAMKALDILYSNNKIRHIKARVLGISENSRIAKKMKNKSEFIFHGYVSKEELEQLYKGAFALIYPSLNEGFGYPPLEAMKYGVPVLASSFASIPEVCGDSTLYFNPYSTKEIMGRVLMISLDKDIHNSYSSKSATRYNVITAKQHEDLIQLISILMEYLK